MNHTTKLVLWSALFTVIPIWLGLALTLVHPDLNKPACVWLVYVAALVSCGFAAKSWAFNADSPIWREALIALGILFAAHVGFFGTANREFIALHDQIVAQPKTQRAALGVQVPNAAPPFSPGETLGSVGSLCLKLAETLATWFISLLIGTPAWCWAALGGTTLWLRRRE